MANKSNVLIIGPGFIGWNVLDLLVSEGYTVTAFVRRQSHADSILEVSGSGNNEGKVRIVLGDLNDKDTIAAEAAAHDIIFHTATADHLPSVEAVIDGLRRRADKQLSTIFIHTSGTSVLDDGSNGAYKSDKIYHDSSRQEIDSVPDRAPHRAIDLAIVRAQRDLASKRQSLAIMIPPLIYGFNPRHKRLTIQIPILTRFALKHGFATHVGAGQAVESQVNVLDLARAYIVLLHYVESKSDSAPQILAENPYYFCENGHEASWHEVAIKIGQALHAAGKLSSPTPRELPRELEGDLFGDYTSAVIGLNSRSRAIRLRELGWEPREKSLWESYLEDELPEILKEDGTEFSGYKGTVAS